MANPALPPGFVLEDDDTPPLPPGFVVEQPKRTAATQVQARKPNFSNVTYGDMLERGNVNLHNRPRVRNADGSISTVRSISANFDGQEVLIPTVSDDGRILSDREAIDVFRRTGKHLGKFKTPEAATAYAEQLHNAQAEEYVPQQRKPPANTGEFASLITGKKPQRKPATYNLTGVPSVSTQIGGMLDAFQRHALNPVHGVAQLVEHGLGKLGVISPETVAQDDAAMRQREDDYQARTAGNAGSYIGAVPGEVLPWMLGLGELRAAGLLPTITQGGVKGAAKKGGLLAAEGAVMGATQPVLGEGSYGAQKGAQVATGAIAAPAIAAGLRGVSAGAGGVREAARYVTPGGREMIANKRVAKMLGTDPATLQALRSQVGPNGYTLTPAQAIGTPEAVQAERVLRNNGLTAPAFAEVESANNASLRGEVERLAGTDADIAAAKAARKAATDPYYQQLKGQRADPSGILAALDGLNNSSLGVRPNIKSAAASLRSEIQSRIGPDGKIPADVLSGLHENAGSHLGPMASAQEKAALGPLRDTIADALDATVPGYRDNLAAYARASQPLTDMATGRTLLGAIDSGGRDAGGNQAVSLTQIKSILSKDDRAKFKMSKQARQQLESLLDALQKRSITNNTIAATGPGTAADTIRGLGQSPLVQRIIGQMGGVAGGALGGAPGYGLGLLATEGLNAANNAVVKQVGRKAASAPLAADAIEAYQRDIARRRGGGLLSEHGMPAFLLPYIER